MSQKILIIDSGKVKNQFLIKILGRLIKRDYWFWYWGQDNNIYRQFKANNWPAKINRWGWLRVVGLPVWWLVYFFRLWSYKQLNDIGIVICLSLPEKITITPIAKLLKLKVIWLEQPNFNYQDLGKMQKKYIEQAEKVESIICFTSATRQAILELGLPEDKCQVILPGIDLEDYLYQDTIFNKLATNPINHSRFTIGTVVDLQHEQRVEMLLQALQTCLSLDPDIQLVLIGAEQERKKITWLIKKMRLDNKVWVISDQSSLKKWFNNFDVLVVASKQPQLEEIVTAIGAMANGIVVIGPKDVSLEDLSFDNKSALLIDLPNGEELARQLIALQQNPEQRQQVSVNAKAVVEKYFMFDRLIKELMLILK